MASHDAAKDPWPGRVIDIDDIRCRYQQAITFLDERGRRRFAANEALAQGYGGVTATSVATGVARSTINDGIRQLHSGHGDISGRIRRGGGGRKSALARQPGLPAALEVLIVAAIRGDPCSPLSRLRLTQHHLASRRWRHRASKPVSGWWRTCRAT